VSPQSHPYEYSETMHPRSQILLLGWQGTLRAAGYQPSATEQERAADRFRPWLDAAVSRLQGESSPDICAWYRQHLPIEQLRPPLVDRLLGIAAASCLRNSTNDRPLLKVDPAKTLSATPYSNHANDAVRQWAAATAMFLSRLHEDRQRLASWAGKSELPAVTALFAANSDIHDAAGTTVRIEFADGSRIFYKPRPVTGELLWYDLTRATAKVNPECAITAARVLLGGNDTPNLYGWMEALEPINPTIQLDHRAYWKSAGSLLCHAWLVNMTDLHMANILATPTGPAVVDAECLATPEPHPPVETDPVVRLSSELAATGLLPSSRLPNISGFFGVAQSVANLRLPAWSCPKNGSATLNLSPATLIDHQNRFGENGPVSCVPDMVDGFLNAAQALVDIRGQLLQRGGWLDRLANQHAPRIIIRDTLQYGLWLTETLLPTGNAPQNPSRANLPENDISALYKVEKLSIESLHVPRFFVPAASRNLAASPKGIVVHDFLRVPVSQTIRSRLQALSLDHLRPNLAPALLWSMLRNPGVAAVEALGRACVNI